MQVITRNSKYLVHTETHYVITTLVANDDLEVDLDKPLEVSSDLFVAGNVRSNVDLSVEGKAIIKGNFSGKTLAAKKGIVIVNAKNYHSSSTSFCFM